MVEERLRSWREESEASSEGKAERLRNVFGIEIDMTLFCGEHVIPCQEHGVWLDGVQEDKTADDDLE